MLPELFLKRMQRLLGEEYGAFCAALEDERRLGLRLNPLKTDRPPALPFSLTPVPWAQNAYFYAPGQRPGLHPFHEAGLYYLQEPSAMAPAELLDPRPGETVLDLCAAPGGKSTQLAALMQNRGLLVCNELHPGRAKILSRNIERMGVRCALVLNEHPARLAERFAGCFDRVLVDAPCSGEGMFRKEAAAGADWSEQTVLMCAKRQDEILHSAAQLLKPGGRLVYSTCTFAPEEDEGSIQRFLLSHKSFSLLPVGGFSPGRPDWLECGLPALCGAARLWPHKLRCEGHFAAVLQKSGGQPGSYPRQKAAVPPSEYLRFAEEMLPDKPAGWPLLFGSRLFAAPAELPELTGLNVLRPGLELGTVKPGRFEPAHALALALSRAVCMTELSLAQADAYFRGQTLPGEARGWTLLTTGDLSVGWAKGSGGILKNHFPKGLRHC